MEWLEIGCWWHSAWLVSFASATVLLFLQQDCSFASAWGWEDCFQFWTYQPRGYSLGIPVPSCSKTGSISDEHLGITVIELSSINSLVYVSIYSNNRWYILLDLKRRNSLELLELSRINKVSLVSLV